MVQRLKRFYRNAGWGGMLRVGFVGGIFTAISVGVGGIPYVLLWLAAWMVGIPIGGWVAQDPARRAGLMDKWAIGLAITALIVGQVRGHVQLDDQTLVTVMIPVVGSYLSSYFFFFSNPAIVRLRD